MVSVLKDDARLLAKKYLRDHGIKQAGLMIKGASVSLRLVED